MSKIIDFRPTRKMVIAELQKTRENLWEFLNTAVALDKEMENYCDLHRDEMIKDVCETVLEYLKERELGNAT